MKPISLLHGCGWAWYFLWPFEYGRGDVLGSRVEDLKGPCGICSHSLRTLGPPRYDKSPFYPIWGWEAIDWGKTRIDWGSLQRASTNCKACKWNHLGPSHLSQATQRWQQAMSDPRQDQQKNCQNWQHTELWAVTSLRCQTFMFWGSLWCNEIKGLLILIIL